MPASAQQQVNEYWLQFVAVLQSKLLRQNGELSLARANLILADQVLDWDSPHTVCGRWLSNYRNENPTQGSVLRDILLKDMRFEAVAPASLLPSWLELALPLAAAGSGYGIGEYMEMTRWQHIALTLSSAAVLYPFICGIRKTQKKNSRAIIVQRYITQLEKYHQSILSVTS